MLVHIEQARKYVQETGSIPMLHIEAHGNEHGIGGPGGREFLNWSDLTHSFQQLNVATRCNLVLSVAACTGFAAINVFGSGPFAPAAALVGPVSEISSSDLLNGTKELCRRLTSKNPHLSEMADNASREASGVLFEPESFALFAFESFTESIIISKRPEQRQLQFERLRKRMINETNYSVAEIDQRMSQKFPLPIEVRKRFQQAIWDEMFLINRYPENQKKFGVNWSLVLDMIEHGHGAFEP